MLKNIFTKNKAIIVFTIGLLLVVLSVLLVFYDHISFMADQVINDMQMKIYNEQQPTIPNEEVTVDTDYLEEEPTNDSSSNNNSNNDDRKYIGFIEIDKIGMRYGLVDKMSYYNNVNRNIAILSISNYPNIEKGNLVLAAHSGSSAISYFKNLYKLVLNDEVKIYFGNNIYTYKIASIYTELKDGALEIKRDLNKTTLTLITCTKNDKTTQTVYIAELSSVTINGGNNE